MIEGLHHIGVAVRSLAEALPQWTKVLGMRLQGIEDVPTERVRVAILWAGSTRIELLEPTSPDSPIAKFIDKRGPGVHHLALKCGDAAESIQVLAAAGAPMLDRSPRPGAHDTLVAFVHPKYLDGVLLELVQDPPDEHGCRKTGVGPS